MRLVISMSFTFVFGFLNVLTVEAQHSDLWTVVIGQPAKPIEHAITLQPINTKMKADRQIIGPVALSHAKLKNDNPEPIDVYFSWYEIATGETAPDESLEITASSLINGKLRLEIGRERFVLMPARRIQSGKPDTPPNWSQYMVAYDVTRAELDGERWDMTLAGQFLAETMAGKVKSEKLKLTHLIVPANYWHHDEHNEITDSNSMVLVFSMPEPKSVDGRASIIDPFGLNAIDLKSTQILCEQISQP